ncbi:unnamed protein product, partial [Adineta steineri]
HEIAEQNRDRIRLEYSKQFNELKDRYALFTKELIDKRDNDDFFEYDIEQLSIKLEQFKQEIYEININLQLNHLDWSRLIHINQQEESPISSYLNNSKLLF